MYKHIFKVFWCQWGEHFVSRLENFLNELQVSRILKFSKPALRIMIITISQQAHILVGFAYLVDIIYVTENELAVWVVAVMTCSFVPSLLDLICSCIFPGPCIVNNHWTSFVLFILIALSYHFQKFLIILATVEKHSNFRLGTSPNRSPCNFIEVCKCW